MAVELSDDLAHLLGRIVPATLLFDYPTIDALTTFVLAELDPASASPEVRRTEDREFPELAAIEQLSEGEIDQMLAQG